MWVWERNQTRIHLLFFYFIYLRDSKSVKIHLLYYSIFTFKGLKRNTWPLSCIGITKKNSHLQIKSMPEWKVNDGFTGTCYLWVWDFMFVLLGSQHSTHRWGGLIACCALNRRGGLMAMTESEWKPYSLCTQCGFSDVPQSR